MSKKLAWKQKATTKITHIFFSLATCALCYQQQSRRIAMQSHQAQAPVNMRWMHEQRKKARRQHISLTELFIFISRFFAALPCVGCVCVCGCTVAVVWSGMSQQFRGDMVNYDRWINIGMRASERGKNPHTRTHTHTHTQWFHYAKFGCGCFRLNWYYALDVRTCRLRTRSKKHETRQTLYCVCCIVYG